MVSIIRVSLLIASLLWCPVRCMASPSNPELVPDGHLRGRARTCSCCSPAALPPASLDAEQTRESSQVPESQPPASPVDDCGCRTCLCRGATMGTASEVDDFAPCLPVCRVLVLSEKESLGLTRRWIDSARPGPLFVPAAGRHLSTLLGTFLL